jgi:uncharacterized cupredoxin-like copper-binding protein
VRALGLAACCVLAAVPALAADVIEVRMVDDKFEPAQIVLEHGKPYRLHLVNAGKEMHEFAAKAFFDGAQVKDAATVLQYDGKEVLLQPGQSRDVDFTAPAPGSYELTCPDHDWDNMVGKIVVK